MSNIAQIRDCHGGTFLNIMETIPDLLSKVRLLNRSDVYLVVDLNPRKRVVEVISITGIQHLIANVPVSTIQEVVEGPPIYL